MKGRVLEQRSAWRNFMGKSMLKPFRVFAAMVLLSVLLSIMTAGCDTGVDSSEHQNPDGRQTYFITLDTQGAQEWETITVFEGDSLAGRLRTPTKEGFVFEGWSASGDEYVPYDLEAPITADLTLYAKWDGQSIVPANTFRLTVHLQGGAFLNVPLQDIPINHKGNKLLRQLPRLNKFPNPPPEFSIGENRKAFAIWNTKPDGSGEYIFPLTRITGDMDIYALYAKPITTMQDVLNVKCNDPNAWYMFENSLTIEKEGFLREPLCQDREEPFRGKILPGGDAYNDAHIFIKMEAPRTHGGLFAYTDGADLIGIAVRVGIKNVSYAAGALVAEAKNTRISTQHRLATPPEGVYRILPLGALDPATLSDPADIGSAEYAGGIVGIGDNVTFSVAVADVDLSGKYVGGLAGKLTNSRISGSGYRVFSIAVSAGGGNGGGLVGYMENGTIELSYSYQSGEPTLTSEYPNVSMGTIAGYLKNVNVRNINITGNCPEVVAERENSIVGMIGVLDGGSVKNVHICGANVIHGANSTAGGIAGRMLSASIEDVVSRAKMMGDIGGVPVVGSRVGGIVGEATGGRIKGAQAMNPGITGETTGIIVAVPSGTEITESY
jgi:uncharacterized repeat protein (TIGR02543 family)